jgi:isopentenyl-diphosphate delta-isomerase
MEISPQFIPAIADDGSEYPIEKMEAHRRAVLHQAVSVFVFSGEELLLQQRAIAKYHCASLWANTCCSHPHWNEQAEVSAERRLFEELGLKLSLRPGATIQYSTPVSDGLWENERVRIFYAQVDRETAALRLDPTEVADVRWTSLSDIRVELATDASVYAPWFRIYMARWSELGIPTLGIG